MLTIFSSSFWRYLITPPDISLQCTSGTVRLAACSDMWRRRRLSRRRLPDVNAAYTTSRAVAQFGELRAGFAALSILQLWHEHVCLLQGGGGGASQD
jgi:hypothetical protein